MICIKEGHKREQKVGITSNGNFIYTGFKIQMNYYGDDGVWSGVYFFYATYYDIKYLGNI